MNLGSGVIPPSITLHRVLYFLKWSGTSPICDLSESIINRDFDCWKKNPGRRFHNSSAFRSFMKLLFMVPPLDVKMFLHAMLLSILTKSFRHSKICVRDYVRSSVTLKFKTQYHFFLILGFTFFWVLNRVYLWKVKTLFVPILGSKFKVKSKTQLNHSGVPT